jgi:hypothetical protein
MKFLVLCTFCAVCTAQQASIQNTESYLGTNDVTNFLTPVQTCSDPIGFGRMCNGATWWQRDKWDSTRLENGPFENQGVGLDDGWPTVNATDPLSGRLFPVGTCYNKPGVWAKLPGARSSARWFRSKVLGQDCADLEMDCIMESYLHLTPLVCGTVDQRNSLISLLRMV